MNDRQRSSSRPPQRWIALSFALAVLVNASSAHAQDDLEWLSFFSARGELGVVGMLPDFQQGTLGQQAGVNGAVRLGVRPIEPLVFQLSYESYFFPTDGVDGQQHTVAGGVRIEPLIEDLFWLIGDANAGVALTGDLVRFTFNVSLGAEIAIERVLGVGVFLRYAHTVAADDDFPSDASMLIGGISVSIRGGVTRGAPGDSDGDGVLDEDDLCPTTHHGDDPDPERPGCPLGDRDGDGVSDRDDTCPETHHGDTPDPQRPGCPLGDRDGDGVNDREDLCPDTHHGDDPDPARRGCPAADSDSDGVLDHDDACPSTPMGDTPDPERRGCPAGDRDADGVVDPEDRCPDSPQGLHPDPDRPGCSLPDRDGDSVLDADDSCPDEFGAPSRNPRRNGCPGLVRIEGGQIRILQPVFFASGRDVILRRSRPVLTAVADALRATPQIRRVRVEGHTDDVGDDADNMDLSRRRAQNVMAFLIQAGVEPGRLEYQGYGETRPLIDAETDQARAVNRRVQLVILDPAPESQ